MAPAGEASGLDLGPARVRFTGRAEGDLGRASERGPSGPGPAVTARRRAVLDRPWTWLRQVHGGRVVHVERPGQHAGTEADAAVTAHRGAALAILTADCAPVALASPEGVIGAAHAGWRGIAAGVLEATAQAMRALGATRIDAALGPCIHAGCYEFAGPELDELAARHGPSVRASTRAGTPALDVPAAVRAALEACGVRLVHVDDRCTACSANELWSHRARGDEERQAMVVWLPVSGGAEERLPVSGGAEERLPVSGGAGEQLPVSGGAEERLP